MANQPAAGWYPDPKDPGQRRYWDGTKWTEHTQAQPAQAPQQAPQPAPAARPARPSPQAPAQSPRAPAQAAPPQAAPAQRPPQAPPAPAAPPARPAPPGPEGPPGGYVAPMPPGGVRPAWTGAPLAGWGHRVGATIIDGLITSIPFVIGIALILGGKGGLGLLLYLLGLVAAFVYYPLTMSRPAPRNGQTIGKQVVGIRVSKDDGQPFNFGTALLREFVVKYLLFGVVGAFLIYIPWLIDVLWPLWDDKNEALHDKIVKTHVLEA